MAMCYNCRYYDPYGECRKNAPVKFIGWPNVLAGDWCGDWEKKRGVKTIYNLGLTTRITNCLRLGRLEQLEELTQSTEKDLLLLRNFGDICLVQLCDALKKHGLELKK